MDRQSGHNKEGEENMHAGQVTVSYTLPDGTQVDRDTVENQWWSVRQVCEETGVSRSYVHEQVRTGEWRAVKTTKQGRYQVAEWRIHPDDAGGFVYRLRYGLMPWRRRRA